MLLLTLLAILPVALCRSTVKSGHSLDVHLTSGTFRGVTTSNGTERWLGIPFAEPPVGQLRFKAPVPISNASDEVQDASTFGNACPQPSSSGLGGVELAEDCLYLNVWRPEGISSDSSLPVLVWFHGGQFTNGAASAPRHDPSRILARSVLKGTPIIFASTNYRMNTFGFLASGTMAPEDLNAGLLDQRLALNFIQNNIAAFGGDPAKVTIWGQSAGAGSVHAHFVFPDERPLFRAGITDSATGPIKNSPAATKYDPEGRPFTRLLAATNCSDLACLRDVPFETLLRISNAMLAETQNGQLWQPAVGPEGSFMPERASIRIQNGNFLHLPFIGGTNINEGATFADFLLGQNTTGKAQDDAFDTYVRRTLMIDNTTVSEDTLETFHKLWPENDTTLGAPFNTGDFLFDRASAFYGQEFFLAPRRLFFEHASALQPMYAYYFGEFIPGRDPRLGVSHATELTLLLGPEPPAVEAEFANQFIDFYVKFVNDLDPGDPWPRYDPEGRNVLFLQRNNLTVIKDDFNLEETTFLNSQRVLDEFEK